MNTSFDLNRFVEVQEDLFPEALIEIKNGRKESHWMWFIFPQIAGLGFSSLSQKFAITGKDEAVAYLQHHILGPRLKEITTVLLELEGKLAFEIFGNTDTMKLKSCMTLFATVSPENSVFHQVLDKYFGGEQDRRTIEILAK
ncbi:MAG TPA: DUF1810 domain-containing protein [Paludibacter sp.]|nr:DUF1810 domain-containing protein [Paludibacter sp.]